MPSDTVFMSAAEAATCLSVTPARVYQLVSARLLPAVKRGRRTLIPRLAFKTYIEQVNRQALRNLSSVEQGTFPRPELLSTEQELRELEMHQEAVHG